MSLKVAVIGGGAAGLMAAFTAASYGNSVTVFERNNRPARKVIITGKGRCNVTNNCDRDTFLNNVVRGGRFLYSAYSAFSTEDTMQFFEDRGVALKTERGNRVFPLSDKAVDIVDALVDAAKNVGAVIVSDRVLEIATESSEVTGVITENGGFMPFDRVILATGGKTYPVTGSTGDGYIMAEKLGHTVTKTRPALVPIMIKENFCSHLCGLSLKNVKLTLKRRGDKKPVYSELGEMMFTDFGVTGPLVLTASSYMDAPAEEYDITLDLKPALDNDALDKRLLRDFAAETNRDFINSLDALLPKRLISVIVANSKIDPRKKINSITREERARLIDAIKHFKLSPLRLRPIEEGIITAGGISLREIDPKTMESKLVSGLFFAGEIIDADALTGGFNLQIAFSTGYLAGSSLEKY